MATTPVRDAEPAFITANPYTAEVPISPPGETFFHFWANLFPFLISPTIFLVIMFKDKERILCLKKNFFVLCPSPTYTLPGSACYAPTSSGQSSVVVE